MNAAVIKPCRCSAVSDSADESRNMENAWLQSRPSSSICLDISEGHEGLSSGARGPPGQKAEAADVVFSPG